MRQKIHLLASIALASLPVFLNSAEAADKKSTVVTIAPRYLTAGKLAHPDEYRGAYTAVDLRFLSTGYERSGVTQQFQRDHFYNPGRRSSFAVDFGPLASKLPGEQ